MQHASLIAAKGPHGSNGRSCKSSIFCHALALRIRIRELPARNQQTLPLRAKRRKSYASCRTPRDLLPIKHCEITILADEKNKKKSTTQKKVTGSSWWYPLKKNSSNSHTIKNWQRIFYRYELHQHDETSSRGILLSKKEKTRDEQEDRCDSSRNTRQEQTTTTNSLLPPRPVGSSKPNERKKEAPIPQERQKNKQRDTDKGCSCGHGTTECASLRWLVTRAEQAYKCQSQSARAREERESPERERGREKTRRNWVPPGVRVNRAKWASGDEGRKDGW